MSTALVGAGRLVRAGLRRDRLLLAGWLGGFASMAWLSGLIVSRGMSQVSAIMLAI